MTLEERKETQIALLKEVFKNWKINNCVSGFTVMFDNDKQIMITCKILINTGVIYIGNDERMKKIKEFPHIDITIDSMISFCEGMDTIMKTLKNY